ncbi:hypothetical protein [Syntrophomonas curvata]
MFRKKWTRILMILLCIWLITSVYYYTQHRITINRCALDKEVTVDGMVVQLNEIVFTDLEKSFTLFRNERYYKTLAKLPVFAQQAYFKVYTFYSKPYKKLEHNYDNRFGIIELRGTLTTDKSIDLFLDRISLVNKAGLEFSGHRGIENKSASTYSFYIGGRYFVKNDKTAYFIIKDENDAIIKSVPIKLEWQSKTYNYFNRPPNRPLSKI